MSIVDGPYIPIVKTQITILQFRSHRALCFPTLIFPLYEHLNIVYSHSGYSFSRTVYTFCSIENTRDTNFQFKVYNMTRAGE